MESSKKNPVLIEFREECAALKRMYPMDWIRVCERSFWGDDATKEQLRHARTVLTRLVNLGRQGAEFPNHTDGSTT